MGSITLGKNIASLQVQGQLDKSSARFNKSLERLSSGLRINGASDDAAGLAVSSILKVDSRVYTQAVRNVNDSISAFSIADGAVDTLTNILTQYKGLAEQSANGSLSSTQRSTLDLQGQSLQAEYNRLVSATTFNGLGVIDGSLRQFVTEAAQSTLNLTIGQNMGRTVGTGSFTSGSVQSANTRTSLATGDFNGDGITDNVSVAASAGTLTFYIQTGRGDGTFSETTKTATNFSSIKGVAVADVNGDGVSDIVAIGNRSGTNVAQSATLINGGTGSFGAAVTNTFTFDSSASLIIDTFAVGDMNGDGKADIAIGWDDTSSTGLSIATGSGTGTFSTSNEMAATFVPGGSLVISDVTGDGRADLVSGSGGAGFEVFTGNGTGTVQSPTLYGGNFSGTRLAVADINGDGLKDIIGAVGTGAQIFLNLGNGIFDNNNPSSTVTGFTDVIIKLADLNGDGYLDLVGPTKVYTNNGSGSFSSYGTHTSFLTSADWQWGVGDTNQDGVVDLIGLQSDNKVYAQLQSTTLTNQLERIDISTQSGARTALTTLSTYLSRLQAERGNIGSSESRLSAALATLQTTREGYQGAYSRIMDVDTAAESAELIKNQILQKAGAAIMAQANLQPQIAVQLLRG